MLSFLNFSISKTIHNFITFQSMYFLSVSHAINFTWNDFKSSDSSESPILWCNVYLVNRTTIGDDGRGKKEAQSSANELCILYQCITLAIFFESR